MLKIKKQIAMNKSQGSNSKDSREGFPIDLNDPLMKWLEKPETRKEMSKELIEKLKADRAKQESED
jgi:hypothetical protein